MGIGSHSSLDWHRIGDGLAPDWHRIGTGLVPDWYRIGTREREVLDRYCTKLVIFKVVIPEIQTQRIYVSQRYNTRVVETLECAQMLLLLNCCFERG